MLATVGAGADKGRDVRRAPVEAGCCERNDRDGDSASADAGGTEQALSRRGANRRTYVVASRNESNTGAESGNEPTDETEREARAEKRDKVSDYDHDQGSGAERARAVTVDQPAAGNLHHEMCDKERRRQEADGPKPDAVRVSDDVGRRPDVGDVVADREPKGNAGEGGSDRALRGSGQRQTISAESACSVRHL
jgi:hypothetical protein